MAKWEEILQQLNGYIKKAKDEEEEMEKKKKKPVGNPSKNQDNAIGKAIGSATQTVKTLQQTAETGFTGLLTEALNSLGGKNEYLQSGAFGGFQIDEEFRDGYQVGDILKTGGETAWRYAKGVLGTSQDLLENVYAGALGFVENTIDTGATLLGAGSELFGNHQLATDVAQFISKDIIDEEKIGKGINTSPAKMLLYVMSQLDNTGDSVENASFLGEKTDSLAQSGGQLLAKAGLQYVGAPWWLTTGVSTFGSEAENAISEGATYGQAIVSGAISTAAEIFSEKLFGGSGLSEKGMINVEKFTEGITNRLLKTLADYGLDILGEGLEEVVSEFATRIGQLLTYEKEDTWLEILTDQNAMDAYLANAVEYLFGQEALESYGEAAVAGSILGSIANFGKVVDSKKSGRNYRTGLTPDEQSVFDRVFEDRVAEAEKNGKKVTEKEKAAIYDAVMEALSNGEISVDTIDEVLGGEEFAAYKEQKDAFMQGKDLEAYNSALHKLEGLEKELAALEGVEGSDAQAAEISATMKALKAKMEEALPVLRTEANKVNQSRETLRSKLLDRVKDNKLMASYVEDYQSQQKFAANLDAYKDKNAKQSVQNIMDSGLINNSRQVHTFVDFIAKVAEDQGVVFGVTDAKRLAGTVHDFKNANSDAFVQGNNITINLDSKRRLNSLVGHELTHVLTNTGFYKPLADAVKQYAIAKGEWNNRLKATAELYGKNDPDADPEAELIADLVGDYIFTDKAFVTNLHTENRNVFQRLFDEIKHLLKLVTAGSNEERQLINAKKLFEEVYREGAKRNSEGGRQLQEEVQHSLSEDTKLADKAIKKNEALGFVDSSAMTSVKALRNYVADQLRSMKDNGVTIPDDVKTSTAVTNSAYGGVTEENTTICPRSLAAEAFVDAVAETLGRPLTVEEQIYISQDLQGRSLTPECTYCYVATDRKAYRAFLGEYVAQRDAVIEDLKNGNWDTKSYTAEQIDNMTEQQKENSLYVKFLNGRKPTDKMSHRFDMWVKAYNNGTPMITAAHLANMAKLMGNINSQFGKELEPQIKDAMAYAQSASWAKKRVAYATYNGHILNWKQSRIDKLNSHYGLRMYSFSDFHPAFVLENMQMITDAAVRGLKVLAYTKDMDFAKIFAPTGANINISTFGFEYGGNVYENNLTGAEWEAAKSLRNQYPNVGITFVATSDAAVEWALKQDWIDVVIPTHLVRTGDAVMKAFRYKDFTGESSDTKNKDWSKDNDQKYIAPTEHNNNKDTYLAALERNNLKPRFARFLENPNYMKLVNECRKPASETKPVQPVFNEDAINDTLARLKVNGYYQPVGGSVERMYEIAAQVAENMTKDLQNTDTTKEGWAKELPAHYALSQKDELDPARQQILQTANEFAKMSNQDRFLAAEARRNELQETVDKISAMTPDEKLALPDDEWDAYRIQMYEYDLMENLMQRYGVYEGSKLAHFAKAHTESVQDTIKKEPKYTETKDSTGRTLSDGQLEYFRDSVVRDDNGRLLTMYHGTSSGGFDWFDTYNGNYGLFGVGSYFTASKNIADTYTKKGNGQKPQVYEVYLNIKNPLDMDAEADPELWRKGFPDVTFPESGTNEDFYRALEDDLSGAWLSRDNAIESIRAGLTQMGFDGITHMGGGRVNTDGERHRVYIAFDEEQVKRVTNQNPTDDYRIDYALSDGIEAPTAGDFATYGADVKVGNEPYVPSSQIYEAPRVKKKNFSKTVNKFIEAFVDKGAAVERLAKRTKNPELEALYNSMYYSRGNAQTFMAEGDKSMGVAPLLDIVGKVTESGKEGLFYDYMHHLLNSDRMSLQQRGYGRNVTVLPGFSATESLQVAQQIETANPEFRRYAIDIYTIMAYLRQKMVYSGIISQDVANRWAEMYPHYVPIRRDVGDEAAAVAFDDNTFRVGAPVKRAIGGAQDIKPLFNTIASRILQTYSAVDKNKFGLELLKTLDRDATAENVSLEALLQNVDSQEQLLQRNEPVNKYSMAVFFNGQKYTFDIDEDIYGALQPTSEALSLTMPILNKVGNIRRKLITEWNPLFAVKNAIKDAQDVLFNSQHAFKTYMNFPRAWAQIIGKGKYFNEYVRRNGSGEVVFDDQKMEFNYGVASPGLLKKVNDFVEMVPRLAEYIASRDQEKSIDSALLDAARVTTNFSAGGDVTKMLNRNGFTFLNASVQGARQFVRNLQNAKAEGLKGVLTLTAKALAVGIGCEVLNELLWGDDEEFEELADYIKENYYIVAKFGDGQFVRIPKGRTVAVIQEAWRQIANADYDLVSLGELILQNLAPANPLDNNIISPIVQALGGKAWHGGDIVPQSMTDMPEAEQFDETTDMISRWLGEKLNFSPMKINYLIDQYTGVIGDVLLPMLTPAAEQGGDTIVDYVAAPWVKEFTTDSILKNQLVSDFYDLKETLARNSNSIKATDEDVLFSMYMNSVNSDLSDLYKEKKEIQESRKYTNSQKYEKSREIQKQIVDTMRSAMDNYKRIKYETDAHTDEKYAIIDGKYFKLVETDHDEKWEKMTKAQTEKYKITSAAGNGIYATDGTTHYVWKVPETGSKAEPGWKKLTDEQIEQQKNVTRKLGISPEKYWSNKEEYDFAYEKPGKYEIAKACGGYKKYSDIAKALGDIDGKDANGKSVSGLRKERVVEYIRGLKGVDNGMRAILYRSEYPADDRYNRDIVEYLNGRDDISGNEAKAILESLGMKVASDGKVTWD